MNEPEFFERFGEFLRVLMLFFERRGRRPAFRFELVVVIRRPIGAKPSAASDGGIDKIGKVVKQVLFHCRAPFKTGFLDAEIELLLAKIYVVKRRRGEKNERRRQLL